MNRNRIATIIYQLLVSFALAFAIVFSLRIIIARAETPDQWLTILTAIDQRRCAYKENPADRAFIRSMINQLTLDDPPPLTWRERRWVETLRKECKP